MVQLIGFVVIFAVVKYFGLFAAACFLVSWWYLGSYAASPIERSEFHRGGQAHLIGIPAVLGFLYFVFQS